MEKLIVLILPSFSKIDRLQNAQIVHLVTHLKREERTTIRTSLKYLQRQNHTIIFLHRFLSSGKCVLNMLQHLSMCFQRIIEISCQRQRKY